MNILIYSVDIKRGGSPDSNLNFYDQMKVGWSKSLCFYSLLHCQMKQGCQMSKCDTGYIDEVKVASILDQKAFIFKSAWLSGLSLQRVHSSKSCWCCLRKEVTNLNWLKCAWGAMTLSIMKLRITIFSITALSPLPFNPDYADGLLCWVLQ